MEIGPGTALLMRIRGLIKQSRMAVGDSAFKTRIQGGSPEDQDIRLQGTQAL